MDEMGTQSSTFARIYSNKKIKSSKIIVSNILQGMDPWSITKNPFCVSILNITKNSSNQKPTNKEND